MILASIWRLQQRAATRLAHAQRDLFERASHGIDLRSPRGVDDALWKILAIAAVAAIAAAVLFPLVTNLLQLGRNANSRIQAPPW